MNIYRLTGIIVGFIVGIIIVAIFYKIGNINGKMKTEYDERQKAIRGQSFKVGYFAMMISLGIMLCLSVAEITLPMIDGVIFFTIMFIGILATMIHSMINGAYWGLNNNRKRYILLFIICTIINLLVPIIALKDGSLFVEGKLQAPFINFLCGLLFVVAAIVSAVNKQTTSDEDEEE